MVIEKEGLMVLSILVQMMKFRDLHKNVPDVADVADITLTFLEIC